MEIDKLRERIKEVMVEEMNEPEGLMWLSFALPKEEGGFKGAVIIRAHGITDALMKCNLLNINPGGEVRSVMIPEESWHLCPPEMQNRLLSKDDINKLHPGGAVNMDTGEPV